MSKEAKARIKINKLLEEAGWRFFDSEHGNAVYSGERLPVIPVKGYHYILPYYLYKINHFYLL